MIITKAKPFLKWVGGKRQLIQQFKDYDLLPPKKFDLSNNTYFEPFVGGGAIFFEISPKNSVISDLNKELITTYKVIKDSVNELILKLKTFENTKNFFLKVREQNTNVLEPLDIAARFIYLNKTAFNGMYRVNKSGKFNVPYGRYDNPLICDEENLLNVSQILTKVEIHHRNYKDVLNYAKTGDFIYFDPPYHPLNPTSTFTSYTSNGFTENDQTELRNTFEELSLRGCFVLLSNSDTDFINNLYRNIINVRIQKVYAGRAINSNGSKRGKISEVIISNY